MRTQPPKRGREAQERAQQRQQAPRPALASRQRWGLTSSLMPAAWLIQVDQTRRRAHGEPENPGEVELHRGDSFLIIWEEDGWTLFERYPGDVAAWTTTVMPEGTEASHHNHILLPSQQVYDGEYPQAPEPNASSSPARGPQSGTAPPTKRRHHALPATAPAPATAAREPGPANQERSSKGSMTEPSSCSAAATSSGESRPQRSNCRSKLMCLNTHSSGLPAPRRKRKCWQ